MTIHLSPIRSFLDTSIHSTRNLLGNLSSRLATLIHPIRDYITEHSRETTILAGTNVVMLAISEAVIKASDKIFKAPNIHFKRFLEVSTVTTLLAGTNIGLNHFLKMNLNRYVLAAITAMGVASSIIWHEAKRYQAKAILPTPANTEEQPSQTEPPQSERLNDQRPLKEQLALDLTALTPQSEPNSFPSPKLEKSESPQSPQSPESPQSPRYSPKPKPESPRSESQSQPLAQPETNQSTPPSPKAKNESPRPISQTEPLSQPEDVKSNERLTKPEASSPKQSPRENSTQPSVDQHKQDLLQLNPASTPNSEPSAQVIEQNTSHSKDPNQQALSQPQSTPKKQEIESQANSSAKNKHSIENPSPEDNEEEDALLDDLIATLTPNQEANAAT